MTNNTLYRAEEAALSTPVLVFLGSCILTVCGFILAFLMNTLVISHLQQAGYTPYNNTSTAQIIFDLVALNDTPLESVWYHDVPGQSLAFAFTYVPIAQAIVSALGFIMAGLSTLVFVIRTRRPSLHPKHSALIPMLIGLGIGLVPIFHGAPCTTITADLRSHMVSDSHQNIAIAMPVQIVVTFHPAYSGRTKHAYYTLDVQNQNGDRIALVTGNRATLRALDRDMSNFLNSQGGQL